FWRGGVAALLGVAPTDTQVGVWLSRLVDAELCQPHPRSRLGNESEYGFRHALLRDAAYQLLGDSDKQSGHRLAGKFLEAAHEYQAAAYHYDTGDLPERAFHCYARAAKEAERLYSVVEARAHYASALKAVSQLPATPENLRHKVDSLIALVAISLWVGNT